MRALRLIGRDTPKEAIRFSKISSTKLLPPCGPAHRSDPTCSRLVTRRAGTALAWAPTADRTKTTSPHATGSRALDPGRSVARHTVRWSSNCLSHRQEAADVCRTSSGISQTGKSSSLCLATFYLRQMFLHAPGGPADHDCDSFSALRRPLVRGTDFGGSVVDDCDLSARIHRGQCSHTSCIAITASASAVGEVVR